MDPLSTSRGGAIAGKMLLLIVAILMCIGVVVVYSSGAGWAQTKFSNREYFLYRHLVFTVAASAWCLVFPVWITMFSGKSARFF